MRYKIRSQSDDNIEYEFDINTDDILHRVLELLGYDLVQVEPEDLGLGEEN